MKAGSSRSGLVLGCDLAFEPADRLLVERGRDREVRQPVDRLLKILGPDPQRCPRRPDVQPGFPADVGSTAAARSSAVRCVVPSSRSRPVQIKARPGLASRTLAGIREQLQPRRRPSPSARRSVRQPHSVAQRQPLGAKVRQARHAARNFDRQRLFGHLRGLGAALCGALSAASLLGFKIRGDQPRPKSGRRPSNGQARLGNQISRAGPPVEYHRRPPRSPRGVELASRTSRP